MGASGKGEDLSAPDGKDAAEANARKKAAERQRLAEALRANLSRRKAQSRDRRAREASQDEAAALEKGSSFHER